MLKGINQRAFTFTQAYYFSTYVSQFNLFAGNVTKNFMLAMTLGTGNFKLNKMLFSR